MGRQDFAVSPVSGGFLSVIKNIEIGIIGCGRNGKGIPPSVQHNLHRLTGFGHADYLNEEIMTERNLVTSVLINAIKVLERCGVDELADAYDKAAEIIANLSGPCGKIELNAMIENRPV